MGRKKDSPKSAEYAETDDWVGRAWRDWCQGLQNYAELGRRYGHKPHTVKVNLVKYSANRAAETEGGIDPTAEYVDGLLIDLGNATQLYLTGDNDNAKLGGLKLRAAIRKDIAGAKGVVTERKGVDHSGELNINDVGKLQKETLERVIADIDGATGDET